MGKLNILQKAALSIAFGKRASKLVSTMSNPQKWLIDIFSGGSASESGVIVTEQTAMTSSAVVAVVKILCETIASLPFNMYRERDGVKDKVPGHPLHAVLHYEPNPEMSAFQFREMGMYHLCHFGNFYAEIQRDNAGRIIALWPILSESVTVFRDDAGNIAYEVRLPDGGVAVLPKYRMLHIPALSRNGLVGISPMETLKEVYGLNLGAQKYGNNFFANGAVLSGVVETDNALSDTAWKRVKEDINSEYTGLKNTHRLMLLEEGLKYKPTALPPETAQLLETRNYSITDIARVFRIPPHLVNQLDKATFSNIEHQSIEFVVHCIRPWLVRWEQEIRRQLLLPSEKDAGFYPKFSVDALLRGDIKARYDAYRVGIMAGFLSANDVREMEDRNPIEGGDKYVLQVNMTTLEQIGNSNPGGDNVKSEN